MSSPAEPIPFDKDELQQVQPQGQTFVGGTESDLEQPLLVATNVSAVPIDGNIVEQQLQPSSAAAGGGGGGAGGVNAGVSSVPYGQTTTTQQQQPPHVVSRVVYFGQRDRRGCCSWLGNVLWLVLGGWHLFLTWITVGITLCATIVGIPFGWQCFKVAFFLLFPFGKQAVYYEDSTSLVVHDGEYRRPSGCCSGGCCCCCCRCNSMSSFCTTLLNIIWAVCVGWILALQAFLTGILLCLTICGIPFGIQCFKLMQICFFPFGMDFTAEERVVQVVEQQRTTSYRDTNVARTTTTTTITTEYEAI